MMPLPVGQEPTPQYVWAPPAVTSRIRRTCTVAGVVLLVAGAVLGVLLVLLAFRLPTSRHAFNTFMVLMSALAAVFLLICGFGAAGVRSYVFEQHLNIAGLRVLRRVLVVFAVATVAVAGFAVLLLLAMADGTGTGLSAGVLGYLLLISCCSVLAVGGTVVVFRRLRPPPAAPARMMPGGPA
jgi:hypothetical protein